MKILGMFKFENNCIRIPLIIGKGASARSLYLNSEHGIDSWNRQKSEPVYIFQELRDKHDWAFKDYAIQIEDIDPSMTDDEIKIHIKHFIFKREDKFSKIKKEVERFERFEKLNPIYREQIPEEVRMYVWRRDNGRCVLCNSNKDLEFDHIIPLSEGGSNTERNIQLLCSNCNKKKSNKI